MVKRSVLLLALAASILPGIATAQVDIPTQPRQKYVTVFGDEKCPPPSKNPDEIVVCKRSPAESQFRIPKAVRNEQSIAKKDDVGARIGLADHSMAPVNCSAVGTQGQFGCSQGLNILGAAKKVKQAVNGDLTPVPDAPQP